MKARSSELLLLLLATFWLPALNAQNDRQEYKFEKKKSYTKSYKLNPSDKISLSNRFGEMKIVAWDKNEIKLDVAVTVKSDDESRAQKRLDLISIEDEKSSGGIRFTTQIGKDESRTNNESGKGGENMQIDYTVYLPAGNPLHARNEFGPMIISDHRGEVTLESKFGSLTTGNIANARIIRVEFGKLAIGQMNNGTLEARFSNGIVNKLTGDVTTEFSHCGSIKVNVDNDVKNLEIKNAYSTVYVDMAKNLAATYQVATSFGQFTNKSNFAIKGTSDERNGHRFRSSFSGTSGAGTAKIKITSSYGEVIAGHDLVVDTNARAKKRAKL